MSVSSTSNRQVLHPAVVSPLPDIVGLGGALAGLGGGLAMAIVAAILSLSLGQDLWHEPKVIASLLFGSGAIAQQGFVAGPALVGSLIHMLISALLGALFGIITRRVLHLTSDFGTPLMAGVIYGLLIWAAAYFVVVPVFAPQLAEIYAPSFIVQHLVYGAVTGLLYTWLRPQPYA